MTTPLTPALHCTMMLQTPWVEVGMKVHVLLWLENTLSETTGYHITRPDNQYPLHYHLGFMSMQ